MFYIAFGRQPPGLQLLQPFYVGSLWQLSRELLGLHPWLGAAPVSSLVRWLLSASAAIGSSAL